MAIWQAAKIEFDARFEEPVQWYLVDRHHRLSINRSRLVVDRGIHVSAVVGCELHQLESPALAVRQILPLKSGENVQQHRSVFCVRAVFNLRYHEWRIE